FGGTSVIPNYCQPIVLLTLSVAGALGFEHLLSANLRLGSFNWKLLLGAGTIATVVPLVMRLMHVPLQLFVFDNSLGDIELRASTWWPIAIATFVIFAALSIRSYLSNTTARVVIALVCIALSFGLQFREAAHGLQAQANFDYPIVNLTTELSNVSGRYVTV